MRIVSVALVLSLIGCAGTSDDLDATSHPLHERPTGIHEPANGSVVEGQVVAPGPLATNNPCPSTPRCVVGHWNPSLGQCQFSRSYEGACATTPVGGHDTQGLCGLLQGATPTWTEWSSLGRLPIRRSDGQTQVTGVTTQGPPDIQYVVRSPGARITASYMWAGMDTTVTPVITLRDSLLQFKALSLQSLDAATLQERWSLPVSTWVPVTGTALWDTVFKARSLGLDDDLALLSLPVGESTTLLWLRPSEAASVASASVPGVVTTLLGDEQGRVFTYSTSKAGSFLTGFDPRPMESWRRRSSAPPLAAWGGRVYTAEGAIRDASTGEVLAQLAVTPPLSSVRVTADRLVTMGACGIPSGDNCAELSSFDPSTRTLQWRQTLSGWSSQSQPTLTNQGTVLVSAAVSWADAPFSVLTDGWLFEFSGSGGVTSCPFRANNAGNVLQLAEGELLSTAQDDYRGYLSVSTSSFTAGPYGPPQSGWTMEGGSPFNDRRAR